MRRPVFAHPVPLLLIAAAWLSGCAVDTEPAESIPQFDVTLGAVTTSCGGAAKNPLAEIKTLKLVVRGPNDAGELVNLGDTKTQAFSSGQSQITFKDVPAGSPREITLLGRIVTSYGRRDYAHTDGVTPFVQLLEQVHAIEGIERIRFTSPHPRGFKDDLVAAYARLPKLCGYVHLPMQSGSNRILRAMNRPYTRERYREIVEALRAVQPDMYFSTDVIVGFPGETDEDFAQTRELFEACNYDMAYIFKYSVRTGTPAAALADQVPDEVKERRNQLLLDILQQNSLRRTAGLVGTIEEVLVEGRDKSGDRFTGRTRGNRVCVFEAEPRLVGQLVPLRIARASVSTLYGELVLAGVTDAA